MLLAILGLILALLSVLFGFISAIPALVCGHIAFSTSRFGPQASTRMVAGVVLILGYLGLLASVVFVPEGEEDRNRVLRAIERINVDLPSGKIELTVSEKNPIYRLIYPIQEEIEGTRENIDQALGRAVESVKTFDPFVAEPEAEVSRPKPQPFDLQVRHRDNTEVEYIRSETNITYIMRPKMEKERSGDR